MKEQTTYIILVIILMSIIALIGITIFLEYYGPTETKTISGYKSDTALHGISFKSDGGAFYRFGDWYIMQYIGDRHVITVTLRKTLIDKKIIGVDGYTPFIPESEKCSDCGGIFS
jgi:hypothetical protein